MRTLAIDPGYERVGIAVLQKDSKKNKLIFSECFKTDSKISLTERVFLIVEEIEKIIQTYKPDRFSIENVFHTNNTKTVLSVAESRGAVLYIARKYNLSIHQYTPLQIKNGVTGYGRATKQQVFSMVSRLIDLPPNVKQDDEIDAIAVGITDLAFAKEVRESKKF